MSHFSLYMSRGRYVDTAGDKLIVDNITKDNYKQLLDDVNFQFFEIYTLIDVQKNTESAFIFLVHPDCVIQNYNNMNVKGRKGTFKNLPIHKKKGNELTENMCEYCKNMIVYEC